VADYRSDQEEDPIFASLMRDLPSASLPSSPMIPHLKTSDEDTTVSEVEATHPPDACPGPDETIFDMCLHCSYPFNACRVRLDRPVPVSHPWFWPLAEVLGVPPESLRPAFDSELDMTPQRRISIEGRATHRNQFVYCSDTGDIYFVKHLGANKKDQAALEYKACQALAKHIQDEDLLLLPSHLCYDQSDNAYLAMPFRTLWTLLDLKNGSAAGHPIYPLPTEAEIAWGIADLLKLFAALDPFGGGPVMLYHGDLHARNIAFDYRTRTFCLLDFGNAEVRVREPDSSRYTSYVLGRHSAAMNDDWDKLKRLVLELVEGPAHREVLKKCFAARVQRQDIFYMWDCYCQQAGLARPTDPHSVWRQEQSVIVWLEAGARKREMRDSGLDFGLDMPISDFVRQVLRQRYYYDASLPDGFVVPPVNGPEDIQFLLRTLGIVPGF